MPSPRMLAVALMSLLAAFGAPPNRVPIVVELFTSEGCSSCPPADELLTDLAHQNAAGVQVIALSEHVDYWDHLGWRDPFSSPFFSARQQVYGDQFKLQSVFTPQLVIDGWASVSGNERKAALDVLRGASNFPKTVASIVLLPAPSASSSGDKASRLVSLRVEDLSAAKTARADVFLAITENELASQVPAGENAGRRLRHTGVVRSLIRVAEIESRKGTYTAQLKIRIEPGWRGENVRGVLIVQDQQTRRIVGAAICNL